MMRARLRSWLQHRPWLPLRWRWKFAHRIPAPCELCDAWNKVDWRSHRCCCYLSGELYVFSSNPPKDVP